MLQKHPSKNPLRGLGFLVTCCYKHAEETPQQINPTGFKRVLKASRFPHRIRFGWETEPTGPRAAAVILLKLTPIVRLECRSHLGEHTAKHAP